MIQTSNGYFHTYYVAHVIKLTNGNAANHNVMITVTTELEGFVYICKFTSNINTFGAVTVRVDVITYAFGQ